MNFKEYFEHKMVTEGFFSNLFDKKEDKKVSVQTSKVAKIRPYDASVGDIVLSRKGVAVGEFVGVFSGETDEEMKKIETKYKVTIDYYQNDGSEDFFECVIVKDFSKNEYIAISQNSENDDDYCTIIKGIRNI